MSTRDNSAAQSVLESVMESAVNGLADARTSGDESAIAVYYHILSVAIHGAEALDLTFWNNELNRLNPDALLKSPTPHRA